MLKYLLIILILLGAGTVFAQKRSTINLIQSKSVGNTKLNGVDVSKAYQGVFKQEYSILSSDSAYIYIKANTFDAFGHVVITQGDTLHIYADKLHYDATTKIATLTDHVKMVDKDATLTTDLLTYNTATRIGTYTGGGKLVNKDNTLTSKNGYYFALSRDSYFRYDVVLTTPDALIKTDTLRYNTGSRIAYFYGPSNIYGTKDKDTLYTENGNYNTKTEQAAFGKNNLYKSGTKSLKGDSLFYDRLKGYGRAVKHITFTDTEQKMILKGNLGEYYKPLERMVVTQNAYVILITEQKDSTRRDSVVITKVPLKDDKKLITIPKNIKPLLGKNVPNVTVKDSSAVAATLINNQKTITDQLKNNSGAIIAAAQKNIDSVKLKAALKSGAVPNAAALQGMKPPVSADQALAMLGGNLPAKPAATKPGTIVKATKPATIAGKTKAVADTSKLKNKTTAAKDTLKDGIKRDSIYMSADTLETRMMTYKDLLTLREQRRLAVFPDTTIKLRSRARKVEKESKYLVAKRLYLEIDSSYLHPRLPFVRPVKAVDTAAIKKSLAASTKRRRMQDSIQARLRSLDPVYMETKVTLSDTARVRVLEAHHNSKLFKSDLQAKADSMFYSSADSVIRLYVKPMIWTQGSQLSGDTVYMQMKNRRLDNMDMFPNAFIVNLDLGDSTHFNQAGGKKLKGYFKNNKLDRMYIDGNGETIYFKRDSGKVTEMERSLSSRIYVYFTNNEARKGGLVGKAEVNDFPINKVKDDDKILKGFIWKPKERPASKEAIIHPTPNTPPKKTDGKASPGKKPVANPPKGSPAAKDSTGTHLTK